LSDASKIGQAKKALEGASFNCDEPQIGLSQLEFKSQYPGVLIAKPKHGSCRAHQTLNIFLGYK
jgi:hypothetical protein